MTKEWDYSETHRPKGQISPLVPMIGSVSPKATRGMEPKLSQVRNGYAEIHLRLPGWRRKPTEEHSFPTRRSRHPCSTLPHCSSHTVSIKGTQMRCFVFWKIRNRWGHGMCRPESRNIPFLLNKMSHFFKLDDLNQQWVPGQAVSVGALTTTGLWLSHLAHQASLHTRDLGTIST